MLATPAVSPVRTGAPSDFTDNILHVALREIVARFPVYRTYIDGTTPSEADRRDIDWAIAQARRAEHAPDASVFDFLHDLLTADLVEKPKSGYSRHAVVRFAMKVQQYSGPVMAKGLEDTAFYRYNRLVSLNEVGGHPDLFGVAVSAFHRANAERARRWPHAMLGTSTHDTKRGEDTRARLNVLSEIPEEWERQVQAWSRIVRARRGDVESTAPPDHNDEYLLYQLLVGAWPVEFVGVDALDPEALGAFANRVEGALIKSVREAKVHSTWAAPNDAYEEPLKSFLRDCLDASRSNPFLDSFRAFEIRIARLGMLNGLAQTLLKLTVPGVPDLYQGTELWDLSLVDPDNRRPIDYGERRRLMAALKKSTQAPAAISGLLDRWQDGRVKLALISRSLALRKSHPALFAEGAYEPLEVARRARKSSLRICAPLRRQERGGGGAAPGRRARCASPAGATPIVRLPPASAPRWRNVLTGAVVDAADRDGAAVLGAAHVFAQFPSRAPGPRWISLLRTMADAPSPAGRGACRRTWSFQVFCMFASNASPSLNSSRWTLSARSSARISSLPLSIPASTRAAMTSGLVFGSVNALVMSVSM